MTSDYENGGLKMLDLNGSEYIDVPGPSITEIEQLWTEMTFED